MATTAQSEAGRVSKTEFVQRVARRANMSVRSATAAYNAIFGEIADLVANGNRVTLTGFGKFYAQEHKGHEVRFSGPDGKGEIDAYSVLKFSATREINKSLSERSTNGATGGRKK